ncbi:hypothetical protein CLAFUW4_14825 [Fulvia fulva]|nr:hypothetical protein CLAFUR0_14818 [Fulvia fulva]WPV23000.1 hypothetical protein CLAFUW4_14825 [Fulvia fulva]WPV37951.1 hypothetical protein CLAFUW7_14826 [Fulvia fulva]
MAPRAYTNYKWHIIGNFYRQHNLTGLTKLTDSQWTTLHARTPWWPTGSPAEKHKLETSAKNHIVPTELAVLQVDDEGEVEWHPDTPVLREPADVRDRGPAPAFKPWKSLPPISEENVTPAAAAAAAAASTHSKGRNAGLDAETEEGDSQEPSGQQELSNHTLQALAGTKSGEREESATENSSSLS